MLLTDSVRNIKGVGEKAEQCLNKMNIYSIADLLEHYPRDYDEFKPLQPISSVGRRQRWRAVSVPGRKLKSGAG